MRRVARRGATLITTISALTLAFGPASAGADIIGPQDPNDPQVDSPWQAGDVQSGSTPSRSVLGRDAPALL